MTHRQQPPHHPTTGHPYVDNALRNAWREYRDYLNQHNVTERCWGLLNVASSQTEHLPPWPPIFKGSHLPRKAKKDVVKKILAAAFVYFEPDYYTPKRALLEIANQNPTNKESK